MGPPQESGSLRRLTEPALDSEAVGEPLEIRCPGSRIPLLDLFPEVLIGPRIVPRPESEPHPERNLIEVWGKSCHSLIGRKGFWKASGRVIDPSQIIPGDERPWLSASPLARHPFGGGKGIGEDIGSDDFYQSAARETSGRGFVRSGIEAKTARIHLDYSGEGFQRTEKIAVPDQGVAQEEIAFWFGGVTDGERLCDGEAGGVVSRIGPASLDEQPLMIGGVLGESHRAFHRGDHPVTIGSVR